MFIVRKINEAHRRAAEDPVVLVAEAFKLALIVLATLAVLALPERAKAQTPTEVILEGQYCLMVSVDDMVERLPSHVTRDERRAIEDAGRNMVEAVLEAMRPVAFSTPEIRAIPGELLLRMAGQSASPIEEFAPQFHADIVSCFREVLIASGWSVE